MRLTIEAKTRISLTALKKLHWKNSLCHLWSGFLMELSTYLWTHYNSTHRLEWKINLKLFLLYHSLWSRNIALKDFATWLIEWPCLSLNISFCYFQPESVILLSFFLNIIRERLHVWIDIVPKMSSENMLSTMLIFSTMYTENND